MVDVGSRNCCEILEIQKLEIANGRSRPKADYRSASMPAKLTLHSGISNDARMATRNRVLTMRPMMTHSGGP